ncbi:uncharacterized protein LOC113300482 [Papaver somniferum]|uniref:uncharacterized protein LOC113300482 n=1 Tax=Papaver somniferum TaxID=3469 RepID=UPI000E6FD006|nr:uncharacterized protein LOC113300482 [Papaver somniferum]
MIQLIRAPIIILQETKMMHCSSWDIKQICGYKNIGWTIQHSVGKSGGMLILWDRDFVEVGDSLVGDYTLSIHCSNKFDNFQWVLTNVYGPNNPIERSDFWIELDNVCHYWNNIPWCIGGDFNTITKCDEKKHCSRITRSMLNFNKFIVEHDLIDLPLKGARFTWSNGQSNPVMCRLDKFLISPSFEQHFPFVSQLAKARPTSDHIPLLLDISDPSWGPSPFRFEAMWFLENGFLQLLEVWCLSFCFAGTPSTVLWLKLQALKEKLKVWNKEVFGHTNTKLNAILSEIQTLDGLAENNILSDDELSAQLQHKSDFEKISKMEEISWKIKSKTKWLQEGDRNTRFFISNASARRRYNRIRQLYIGNDLVSDRGRLQTHIVDYYKTLFTEEEVIRPNLEGIEFDSITPMESEILDVDFSEEEVTQAIRDLGSDKAPGPDGFPVLFF